MLDYDLMLDLGIEAIACTFVKTSFALLFALLFVRVINFRIIITRT